MRFWAANLGLAAALGAQVPSLRPTLGSSPISPASGSEVSRVSTPTIEADALRAADVRAGKRMIEGTAAERSVTRGLELLESAAAAKYMPALLYLGQLYELGADDVVIDNKRSANYYRPCAEAGVLECQFGLGRLLVSDSILRVEGMAWLELAAERGSADARKLFNAELTYTSPGQLERARAMRRILLPK